MKALLLLACSLVLCKDAGALDLSRLKTLLDRKQPKQTDTQSSSSDPSQVGDFSFLRGYAFIAAAPNNGSPNTTPASFGILPVPQPMVPVVNSTRNAYLAGAGMEERFNKCLGAGVELAGIAPGGGKIITNTIGTMSPNVFVHFAGQDWVGAKTDFYFTGGYTLLFRDFSANGVNGGAGVSYWFKDRLGANIEFRFTQVYSTPLPPPTFASRYYEIRFGLTFR